MTERFIHFVSMTQRQRVGEPNEHYHIISFSSSAPFSRAHFLLLNCFSFFSELVFARAKSVPEKWQKNGTERNGKSLENQFCCALRRLAAADEMKTLDRSTAGIEWKSNEMQKTHREWKWKWGEQLRGNGKRKMPIKFIHLFNEENRFNFPQGEFRLINRNQIVCDAIWFLWLVLRENYRFVSLSLLWTADASVGRCSSLTAFTWSSQSQ